MAMARTLGLKLRRRDSLADGLAYRAGALDPGEKASHDCAFLGWSIRSRAKQSRLVSEGPSRPSSCWSCSLFTFSFYQAPRIFLFSFFFVPATKWNWRRPLRSTTMFAHNGGPMGKYNELVLAWGRVQFVGKSERIASNRVAVSKLSSTRLER